MLAYTPASLRTGIVRLVFASAVVIASLAIAAGTASAHSGWWSGDHNWHSHWGWSHGHGHCHHTPAPTAAFSFTPAAPFAGDSVQFDASASTAGTERDDDDDDVTAAILTYAWNFGDGSTAEGVTPTHTFTDAGTYNVTLTATNDGGKSATLTTSVLVAPLPVPVAAFVVDPAAPLATHVAHFNGTSSSGGESNGRSGTIVSYAWDFGDGATADGATADHAFAAPGSYTVALTVTNDSGKSDTASHGVEVAPLPKPVPTAAFSLSPSSPVAERTITFDAGASSGGQTEDAIGTIVAYDWDFGDGSVAQSATPVTTHVFAGAATLDVKLTVTNDAGESDTAVRTVSVAPAPPPYDPGGGPKSAAGGTPVADSPAPPQSIVTTSRASGGTSVALTVGFALAHGSDAASACSGNANVVVSAGSLRKVSGKAALAPDGSGCRVGFNLHLPKAYAGKNAKFAVSFAGNRSVAAWSLTRRLKVK